MDPEIAVAWGAEIVADAVPRGGNCSALCQGKRCVVLHAIPCSRGGRAVMALSLGEKPVWSSSVRQRLRQACAWPNLAPSGAALRHQGLFLLAAATVPFQWAYPDHRL